MKKITVAVLMLVTLLFTASFAYAMHPLITDDAGTSGQGKGSFELNLEYASDKVADETATAYGAEGTFTYGVIENGDIVLTVPYGSFKLESGGVSETVSGLTDVAIDFKYKFFEKEGLSLAVRPGLTLPTGDFDKGLGSGKPTYGLFLIATKELKPFAVSANIGYWRNEVKDADATTTWHASLAAVYEASEHLSIVGNIGVDNTPENDSDNKNDAFILGGVVYNINEDIDVNIGLKLGLTEAADDYAILPGLTFGF